MRRVLLFILLLTSVSLHAQRVERGTVNAASTDCSAVNACVTLPLLANDGSAVVTIQGTFVGTLQFEGTDGSGVWVSLTGDPLPSGAGATSATATGTWVFNVAALNQLRVRTSAYTSGGAVVQLRSSAAFARRSTFTTAPTFATMTAGSVLFAGTGGLLSQDNANLNWDDTNNNLHGLGILFGDRTVPAGTSTNTLKFHSSGGGGNYSFGIASDGILYYRRDDTNTDIYRIFDAGQNAMAPAADNVTSSGTQFLRWSNVYTVAATVASMTAGSVLFAGTGGLVSQDNTGLFWDDTNNFLGIGTLTPQSKLSVIGNARVSPPVAGNSVNMGFGAPDGTDGWVFGRGIIANDTPFRIYDNIAGEAVVTINQAAGPDALILDAGHISEYDNIATVGNGVPVERATVDLTAQGAAIGATTIYPVPAAKAGMYRVCYVAKVTTADGVSSTLGGGTGFEIVYTDQDDSVVITTAAGPVSALDTTQAQVSGCIIANAKASTNLQYLFGYTSDGGAGMVYNLHVKVEALL